MTYFGHHSPTFFSEFDSLSLTFGHLASHKITALEEILNNFFFLIQASMLSVSLYLYFEISKNTDSELHFLEKVSKRCDIST